MTTAQIIAIRGLDPEDEYAPAHPIAASTAKVLQRNGYIVRNEAGDWECTERGLRTARRHVQQTGNGPERMKAMFRF